MRDDRSRLTDILFAIERQVWVLYHLQIIGEACRGLSESFRVHFPNPVWTKAVGLRNILVHHYFEIDGELIWQIVEMISRPFDRLSNRPSGNW